MKPLHITCAVCEIEFSFGEGWIEHLREVHGWLIVHLASGSAKYVPILSHPAQKEQLP